MGERPEALAALSVSTLKSRLQAANVDCSTFVEKSEFIAALSGLRKPTADGSAKQGAKDPATLDTLTASNSAEAVTPEAAGDAGDTSGTKQLDRGVLRKIELEVMELRADLETQGLFRDSIQEICDEKRQRLIAE